MPEKTFKILIIGDSMLDEYVMVNHHRESPEAPVPILDEIERTYRLGGAANVALNVKNLGAEAYLISISGNDDGNIKLVNELNHQGIKHKVILDQSRPTTIKTRFINKDYDQFFRLDKESNSDISAAKFLEIEAAFQDIIENNDFDAIILQDYNKGLCIAPLIKGIQNISKKKNIPLFVDPKRNNFKLLSKCDFFKPNLTEVKQFLNIENDQDLNKVLNQFNSAIKDQKNLIITLGSQGIYYKSAECQGLIPGHDVLKADVSGAGDTVISSICYYFLKSYDLKQIAALANKAGAISCKKRGISSVTSDEIEKFDGDT